MRSFSLFCKQNRLNYLHLLGSKEIVNILLENGANFQHSARDGYQALIYAAKHGNRNEVLPSNMIQYILVYEKCIQGTRKLWKLYFKGEQM